MEELDIAVVKKKSISGIIALTSRTFILQCIAFGSTVLLTIFLTPQIFGIFYVVSAFIAFLSYFSDIGLAAALIQKKDGVTSEDLATTFTIQESLVVFISVCLLLATPFIGSMYNLDVQGIWLLRALIISFFLSSLKTIPSVLLERKLEFQKLIVPQLLETIGFYAVAVYFAWQGHGINCFTYAVCTRAIVGLVTIYCIAPWRISIGYSYESARHLLKFGIPFQVNSLLALVKDDLLTIVLGKVLPFAQIGYIGWAKKWAEVPLRLIMDSVIRVTFPAFSRIQHDKQLLGKALDKTLFGLALVIFPISVGLVFSVAPLISFIPKYSKWNPALFSFYMFVMSSLLAAFSTPLTNALNAVGRISVTLRLMILWTMLTWILTLVGIYQFGYNGVSIAAVFIGLTVFYVIYLTKREAEFAVIQSIWAPGVSSILLAIWFVGFRSIAILSPIHLIGVALSGAILYGGIVFILAHREILNMRSLLRI